MNNAATYVGGRVDDVDGDLAAFGRQLAVNVGGVTTAIRAAARILGNGGRIITVGSMQATRPGFAGATYPHRTGIRSRVTRCACTSARCRRHVGNPLAPGRRPVRISGSRLAAVGYAWPRKTSMRLA
ncbi:hypothetical protein [Saccharothrix deserti]|uniref:hypothetical protein n=1 Tax=Saccharothrix deserti TaxID=2593674 RepID=UPI001EE41983|nr:hypothetical protein [Saccharothrix deserti]